MLKKEFLLQNKELVRKMFVEENHTVKETAKAFNCSTSVLQRFMREEGITKKPMKKLEDLPTKENIKQLISQGLEYSDICQQLHITVDQLAKVLEIGRFSNKIDESFIAMDSPLLWYLLGLICSDGHNAAGDSIGIYQKDGTYLNGLRNLIGHQGTLYKAHTGYELHINSPKLSEILNKYQINSDKRYSVPYIKAPTLELESCFIRGLFDGDGCIYYNYISGSFHNQRIEITSGSPNMMEGLKDLYNRLSLNYTVDCRTSSANNPYYVIYVRATEDLINLGTWIYSNKFSFMLKTKRIKFLKFLDLLLINKRYEQVDDIVGTN